MESYGAGAVRVKGEIEFNAFRLDFGPVLCWTPAVNGDAAHMATVAMIVVESEVLHAAVVPESHGPFCPAETARNLFPRGLGE